MEAFSASPDTFSIQIGRNRFSAHGLALDLAGEPPWRGELAFSMGASHAWEGAVLKVGATVDGRGNGGANAGVGFQF